MGRKARAVPGRQASAELRSAHREDPVLRIVEAPERIQSDASVVSIMSFMPLLGPLLMELDPKRVCAIGLDWGPGTRMLGQWCLEGTRQLHVVNPALPPEASDDDIVTCHRQSPTDFLDGTEPFDLYLIEGDADGIRGAGQLEIIAHNTAPSASSLVLLHDAATAQEDHERPDQTRGEERATVDPQGVRAAVERFTAEYEEWNSSSTLPSVGLSVLWHPGEAGSRLSAEVDRLRDVFAGISPILTAMESDGIRLTDVFQSELERQAAVISDQLNAIDQLQQTNASLHVEAESRSAEIRRQAEIWAEQQLVISGLSEVVANLRWRLDQMRSPRGWVKARVGKL